MKKTLLAAALLAGFAGAAHAQSSVTLYGIVDGGLNYTKIQGQHSKAGVDSGTDYMSRFGLRGSEDLGNGLKAIFTLENGFAVDSGSSLQGGTLFGRYAYVGLDSATAGRLTLGRTTSTQYMWAANIVNPFGLGFGNGSIRNTFSYNDWDLNGGQVNNSVYYYSPIIAGFQGAVGYSFQNDTSTTQEVAGSGNNNRLLDLGLKYDNGPLQAVVTYQYVDNKNTQDGNFKSLTAGGNYNFGFVDVFLGYQDTRNIHCLGGTASAGCGASTNGVAGGYNGILNGQNANFTKDKAYTVGASAPVGASGKAIVAYQRATKSQVDAVSLGYVYTLSKRTGVYGLYSWGHTHDFAPTANKDLTSQQAAVGLYTMF